MKNLLIAMAVVATSAFVATPAQAHFTATPVYACHLQAEVIEDAGFYFILRVENVYATGVVSCISATGQVLSQQPVNVFIQGGGIGLGMGIPGSLTGLNIFAVKAGIATPQGMAGQYSLQAGPGLSLIGVRAAAQGGVEMTPGQGYAAKIEVVIEQRIGIGIDFSASTMVIQPSGPVHAPRGY